MEYMKIKVGHGEMEVENAYGNLELLKEPFVFNRDLTEEKIQNIIDTLDTVTPREYVVEIEKETGSVKIKFFPDLPNEDFDLVTFILLHEMDVIG